MIDINVQKNVKYRCLIYRVMMTRDRVIGSLYIYYINIRLKHNVKSELKVCRNKNYKVLVNEKQSTEEF